jgi:hypothetical protein
MSIPTTVMGLRVYAKHCVEEYWLIIYVIANTKNSTTTGSIRHCMFQTIVFDAIRYYFKMNTYYSALAIER